MPRMDMRSKTMKVKVYRNLTQQCYSVMHKGIVIAHVLSCKLTNATFKVSEAGRQRVIKQKRKNVHAFIEGEWDRSELGAFYSQFLKRVSYNPYEAPYFMDGTAPVHKASEVYLTDKGAYVSCLTT